MNNNEQNASEDSNSSNSNHVMGGVTNPCAYCSLTIDNDDYLQCDHCQCNVHIRCLRHGSTPGDLLGDVFFDFTCNKCSDHLPGGENAFDGPSTSAASHSIEKIHRQKLPWLKVITLTLHNLTLKSTGLSHRGYFHWRTHIVSFIEKNWNYLFDPATRRRKKWIGSVSGCLSHNSPEFFLSGQELFHETGWWKLRYANQTPRYISKLYEQLSQKRQQVRLDKRLLEDTNATNDNASFIGMEPKRMRHMDSDEEFSLNESCSRTIPYMGRNPKVAKPLNIIDVDTNKTIQHHQKNPKQQQCLNTVQSSLMDFLAENLASDDLFHDLPNIASEPVISLGKNDDLLSPLIGSYSQNRNNENNLFDVSNIKQEIFDANGAGTMAKDGKLKSFYLYQEQQSHQPFIPIYGNENESLSENMSTISTNDSTNPNDDEDEEEEEDEFIPRIIQVTNFQHIENNTTPAPAPPKTSPMKVGKNIKREFISDAEQTDYEDDPENNVMIDGLFRHTQHVTEDDGDSSSSEGKRFLGHCKESLFTKRNPRPLPWLIQNKLEEDNEISIKEPNEIVTMMSVYEETELLNKLRKIVALESKCNFEIPSWVRRFYRKLCVREWKREHSKPIFNLDDFCGSSRKHTKFKNAPANVIDRYRLLTQSSNNARSSFYARIAGSFQYELFESPYTQRVLHPFIYKNTKCFPPWLKLMCELQYAVNGVPPARATIDFCYVRPNHIAAVNAMLQTLFWPGIDMSECLSYPDFSVVALYKKLVIGCAFLVPDVGFNEAYISFMAVRPNWQRSGIATFMLYHLIQTCMGKDITLHVSASNPAVVLYQKFGFKIEEVILDFYEKYLPLDSKDSRNAFFLRLMR